MLPDDTEIIHSLSLTSSNDHRKAFVAHLFNKRTNNSIIKTIYAYYKKDALILAKEYCSRFQYGYRLVDLRIDK